MQVLCLESMETLRKEVSNNPDLVNEEWDYLESTFDLHCVNFNIDVGKIRDLKTDTKEAKNCVAIYEDLENLTPAHATDERLWTTLCFRECAQYARARWPIGKINKGTNKENFALGHWFTSTNRDRYRNNAISRLWWMAHMTKKVAEETKMEHDKVIDILLSDSDFRAATIERTTSSSATKVVAAIIKINQER